MGASFAATAADLGRMPCMTRRGLAGALALLVVASVAPAAAAAPDAQRPGCRLVIGHRGAPGYRPEHTLASYELAARMGADYIEADLVSTKDGVLVARHENDISGTTDVAAHREFRARRTTKTIDGVRTTGWFTEDFTLAELRTLRAKERLPAIRPRNTKYNGRYRVPTLQEIIDLTRRLSGELGRDIGLYLETKHPTYFRSIGKPIEPPLVDALRRNGLDRTDSKVFIESFEPGSLRTLHQQVGVRLVQLLAEPGDRPADFVRAGRRGTYRTLATPRGLRTVAEYAKAVGPAKDYVIPVDARGRSRQPTSFVRRAHAAGLAVHPYTFRSENQFLPAQLRRGGGPHAQGDAIDEYRLFFAADIDGVFSDYPDTAVRARGGTCSA
jgi:glycerophosphoryl diester phosphodiesterase